MVLGWNIAIYRQADDESSPPEFDAAQGPRVAVWQTGLGGLGWIHELVADGRATLTGSNSGYPDRYTAQARDLLPHIADGPPDARAAWQSDPTDTLLATWEGQTRIDRDTLEACAPDEWLIVEAWDES